MRLGCRGDDAGRRALLQPVEEEAANLRTEACDERSAMNVATVAPLPAADLMRADAMRVLVLLRPTMARFAPSAASASAAANPMPLVAPVIRICLSFTAQQSTVNGSRGRQRNAKRCLVFHGCRKGKPRRG